jgi:hypothetical protein
MRQVLEIIGAGEGNRTLVISLEGWRAARVFKANSDKLPGFEAIESQRLISAVRTPPLAA